MDRYRHTDTCMHMHTCTYIFWEKETMYMQLLLTYLIHTSSQKTTDMSAGSCIYF